MPCMWEKNEGQRHDESRDKTMAMPFMRYIDNAQDKHVCKDSQNLPPMAFLQRRPSRLKGEPLDVLEKDRMDLEDMADSPFYRRGP